MLYGGGGGPPGAVGIGASAGRAPLEVGVAMHRRYG